MKTSAGLPQNYFYIDLLRTVAAIAVVIIHVIGPYRSLLGDIPDYDWLSAIGFNTASRWAVPVFIMISGALMLPDTRPFNFNYFLSRRMSKVLVPFLTWSLFYSLLGGVIVTSGSFTYDAQAASELIRMFPEEETWYHLGYYHYFIPLYFAIPFLAPAVQQMSDDQLCMLVLGWLLLTLLYLLRVESAWYIDMVMYGGYLILGYAMVRITLQPQQQKALVWAGCLALVTGFYATWDQSSSAGSYSPGRLTSYKTLNTAVIAAMVFLLCRNHADKLGSRWKKLVGFIGRYSLGLYLVHPLVLWPVRHWELQPGFTLLTVPLVTAVVIAITLGLVWLMGKSRVTAWMVP